MAQYLNIHVCQVASLYSVCNDLTGLYTPRVVSCVVKRAFFFLFFLTYKRIWSAHVFVPPFLRLRSL